MNDRPVYNEPVDVPPLRSAVISAERTGVGAAASRFGKLPRRTWEIVVEATVGRRRPKDSAPDLRGRLSRICGFGGFLPRAVSGAFFTTADFQRSRLEIHPHGVKLP